MSWERLLRLDRRIIFLVIGIVILLPMIFPVRLPMGYQKMTMGVFDTIEKIDPSKQCVLISTDYQPQTEAENQPMTIALMRHAFARRVPVLLVSLYVESTPLTNSAMEQVMEEFNSKAKTSADSIKYGRDVAFLGWVPPPIVAILGMGKSFTGLYKVDFRGMPTDSLPMMKNLRNYEQVGIVCAISGYAGPIWYVQLAQPKWGVRVGAGTTAVSAPDYYPYFETGQFSGILGGMKGAAEYEQLVEKKYHVGGRMRATEGMGSQSSAHLAIMAFVILGNIAFFASRRRKG